MSQFEYALLASDNVNTLHVHCTVLLQIQIQLRNQTGNHFFHSIKLLIKYIRKGFLILEPFRFFIHLL